MKLDEIVQISGDPTNPASEYSKVILGYVSLVVQNTHLNGNGDTLEKAGIGSRVEKQQIRRELNTIWI